MTENENKEEDKGNMDAQEQSPPKTDSSITIDKPESSKPEETEPETTRSEVASNSAQKNESTEDEVKKTTKSTTNSDTNQTQKNSSKSWVVICLFIFCIILAGGIAGASYYALQLIDQQKQNITRLQKDLGSQQNAANKNLAQLRTAQNGENKALQDLLGQTQQRIVELEQRVSAQAKRLSAMSDTSRDDWLLAEAEYLLKLANQRVRIERSPDGADALLAEADAILRDMDNPDLHSLRRAIAHDLASLRLLKKIDVEGIYLSLVALAEQVEKLSIRTQREKSNNQAEPLPLEENIENLSIKQRIERSWGRVVKQFNSYYRVIDHEEKPKPLLPPSDVHYLKQNLRLILERAQLALLREQEDVYRQSLQQADKLIQQYFTVTPQISSFREEINQLSNKSVIQELPNIKGSLDLLHEYIENLHNLKGLDSSAQKTSSAQSASGENI